LPAGRGLSLLTQGSDHALEFRRQWRPDQARLMEQVLQKQGREFIARVQETVRGQ
jgi:hypothetical protein